MRSLTRSNPTMPTAKSNPPRATRSQLILLLLSLGALVSVTDGAPSHTHRPAGRKARRPTAAGPRGVPCIRSPEFRGRVPGPSLPRNRIGGRLTKEVRASRDPPWLAPRRTG